MQPPDPLDRVAWDAYIRDLQIAAGERVRAEVDRLRAAGVIDAEGRVLPSVMAGVDPVNDEASRGDRAR